MTQDLISSVQQQNRLLKGLLTTVLVLGAVMFMLGASQDPAPSSKSAKIDELTVQRLNVVEPDGTMRLVVSSRDKFPGSFVKGTEIPRPDRRHCAGLLFVDDTGTECGGLIYGAGQQDQSVQAGLSLTFDRFLQDQVLQLLHEERGGQARTGVVINDRPEGLKYPITDLIRDAEELAGLPADQQEARAAELQAAGKFGHQRAYLGTTRDQGSALLLCDAVGRGRLLLKVSADGEPQLQILDEQGEVQSTLALTPVQPEKAK